MHELRRGPRQLQSLPHSQPVGVLERGLRVGSGGGLPQPADLRQRAICAASQQGIEPATLRSVERFTQHRV